MNETINIEKQNTEGANKGKNFGNGRASVPMTDPRAAKKILSFGTNKDEEKQEVGN